MSESNKNPILNWSYEKPTEEGLYLACRGDVETEANINPFRLSFIKYDETVNSWPLFTRGEIGRWHRSFKFAKLCVGKEARS